MIIELWRLISTYHFPNVLQKTEKRSDIKLCQVELEATCTTLRKIEYGRVFLSCVIFKVVNFFTKRGTREEGNQSRITHLSLLAAAGLVWKLVNLTAPNICKALTF